MSSDGVIDIERARRKKYPSKTDQFRSDLEHIKKLHNQALKDVEVFRSQLVKAEKRAADLYEAAKQAWTMLHALEEK